MKINVTVSLTVTEIRKTMNEGFLDVTNKQVRKAMKDKRFRKAVAKDLKTLWIDTGGDMNDGYYKFFDKS